MTLWRVRAMALRVLKSSLSTLSCIVACALQRLPNVQSGMVETTLPSRAYCFTIPYVRGRCHYTSNKVEQIPVNYLTICQ